MRQPLNLESLAAFVTPELRAALGVGAPAWRYSVLVPLEEVNAAGQVTFLADDDDLESLSEALCNHFRGVSNLPPLKGWGLRDPAQPETLELNKNVPFVIYAGVSAASDRYFQKLQQELGRSLDQGLILVERQEVFLLAGQVVQ
jgi:hypothetical protein